MLPLGASAHQTSAERTVIILSDVWGVLNAYGPDFIYAYWVTIKISIGSLFLAIVAGVVFAFIQTLPSRVAHTAVALYVETFRNLPLLVVILIMYVGLGRGGIQLGPWVAGICALGLYTGAYVAEALRAGIRTIGPGQYDAALTLGLSRVQISARIIFPQAVRIVIAPLGSLTIAMIKNAAIVGASLLALGDLLYTAKTVSADTFKTNEAFFIAALGYLSLTGLATVFFRRAEQHWKLER